MTDTTCPTCHGDGFIDGGQDARPCADCSGTGVREKVLQLTLTASELAIIQEALRSLRWSADRAPISVGGRRYSAKDVAAVSARVSEAEEVDDCWGEEHELPIDFSLSVSEAVALGRSKGG